jgi:hypothetical protein
MNGRRNRLPTGRRAKPSSNLAMLPGQPFALRNSVKAFSCLYARGCYSGAECDGVLETGRITLEGAGRELLKSDSIKQLYFGKSSAGSARC